MPTSLYVLTVASKKLVPLPLPDRFPYAGTRAAWSLQNTIAFTGEKGSVCTVWTVKPDGSQLTQFLSEKLSYNVEYPHW